MRSMRRFSLLLALLSGCLHHQNHVAVDGAVLGRVVVYRNGVAFFERYARVVDGKLEVNVPRDKVDDFLKSLTVVDPRRSSRARSLPRKEADDGSYLTMKIETPDRRHGRRAPDLRHRGAVLEAELPGRRRRPGQGDDRGLGDRRDPVARLPGRRLGDVGQEHVGLPAVRRLDRHRQVAAVVCLLSRERDRRAAASWWDRRRSAT